MREGPYSEEEDFHLLNQFEHILESDPLIDEVGFIHPSQFVSLEKEAGGFLASHMNMNFWIRDHKLGISTQVLLPLYKVAKSAFMAALAEYKMHSSPINESENESISCSISCSHHTLESEVMKHSRALLLLSCDFGTAWNARKLILLRRQQLSIFMDELLLSGLILSNSPKSEQAWNHRRWIIKVSASKFLSLQEIVGKESELVEKIAERSKMNYRAWNHRCWLVSYMTSKQVLHELKRSKNWAGLHVADSSCFHYRRRLILKILVSCNRKENESSGCNSQAYQTLKEELEWSKELIKRYVGREALWLHRRFLSVCWVKHFTTYLHGVPCQTEQNISTNNDLSTFMDNEISLLNSCTSVPDNEFEDFQAQASHSATYMLWLTKQIPETWRLLLQEKIGTEKLKGVLNTVCPERSYLWDHLVHLADTSSCTTED